MLNKGEKYRTIVSLPDGLEVQINTLNWVLFIPPKTNWYFSSLRTLADSLFDYEIKKFAVSDERKTLVALAENIEKARGYMDSIIGGLIGLKTAGFKRFEKGQKAKDARDDQ